jgi:hypothetical protein
MVDSIGGYATVSGCAKLLQSTYWTCWETIKRKNVATVRLTGSQAVLVRVADMAAALKSGK